MESSNIGRRVKLQVRSAIDTSYRSWTGVLIREDALTWSVKTDKGEEVTEPKGTCSVLWDVPAKNGA